MNDAQTTLEADRKRRIRRNVVLLALTALAFYVSYIVVSIR
jgi:hypothetical protein